MVDIGALVRSALSAVPPWRSPDSEPGRGREWYERIPQQKIDICLMCPFCADSCDVCDGNGNLHGKRGRPKKEIDAELLREMLKLHRCREDICTALGVSAATLDRAKQELMKEERT